jgi:hypothetical protein
MFHMNKIIKKGLLLFAGIMALTAFAVPAMASAANWGVPNTNHTLTSSAIVLTSGTPTPGALQCTSAQYGVHVRTPASSTLDITSATLSGCTGTSGAWASCNWVLTAAGLPWTATAASTSSVTVNANFTVNVTNQPGNATGCILAGNGLVLAGPIPAGTWNAAAHSLTFPSGTATLRLSFMGSFVANVNESAVFTDPLHTLTLA